MEPVAFTHLLLRTPDRVLADATVVVAEGRFRSVEPGGAVPEDARAVDCRGYAAVPGLVNAHDHLLGAWAPRFGKGPYRNVYGWIEDYHPSAVRAERDRVPHGVVVQIGAYRNLLSGATFVAEHFMRGHEAHYGGAPVAMFGEYGREWLVRSLTDPQGWPSWGRGVGHELALAAERGLPFIIHVAEGIDDEARRELQVLDQHGGLRRETVCVHGLGLTAADTDRMAEVGAAMVWCPSSNHFLYNATADPRPLIDRGLRVGLGTDSPMSGGANMLAEIRSARTAWRLQYGEDPDPALLLRLATTGGAAALGLAGQRGAVAPGLHADLLLFPARQPDPAADVLGLEPWDLELVVVGGTPAAGAPRFAELFEANGAGYARVQHADRPRYVVGDPVGLLERVAAALGQPKALPFLPLSRP